MDDTINYDDIDDKWMQDIVCVRLSFKVMLTFQVFE